MNTALSWIKAYVPELDCTAREYTDAMTLTGTKVEGFHSYDKNLENIVIGQVVQIDPHPNADKLVICQVNVGKEEPVQIVTGAPNVTLNMKVPVVLDGGKVAGGHDGGPLPEDGIRIKKGKLRGVESFGMMCSIEELGSSKEFYPDAPEDGLYQLKDDAPVGADAVEYLGLHDTVFEYEITSNRVDCYSVIGIAREAAATFRKPFVLPQIKETGNSENINDYLKVSVIDQDLCPRYCARMVKNIKIGPSPEWMQRRLAASGIRPINNLVDITNYVMEEYGQPMHAFDYDTLAGHEIVVKRAVDGETFVTLDGQERKLDHDIIMICDGEKEVGIGGIMGGDNSKITDNVKTVVFEGACFDGTNIRLSAKRLGLRTDASGKFEKGLDPHTAMDAVNRACQLVEELGCGEVIGGVIDICTGLPTEKHIPFDQKYINDLLGTDLSKEEMLGYFKPLEIVYDETADEVICPTFRQDLLRKCDIAEEVARFFGYDRIPTTLPGGGSTSGELSWKLRIEEKIRDVVEFNGFSQAMTYSFESPKVFDKLMLDEDDPARRAITIINPLGEDFSIMRTLPLNGLLTSLSVNYNRRNKSVRLYELCNIYLPKALPLTELPDERMQLVLGMYDAGDFYDIKGVVEEILSRLGMNEIPVYDPKAGKNFLHPGRQAKISYDGVQIGYLGELHPQAADNYGLGSRTYIAVLDLPELVARADFNYKFTEIPRFPAVTRDISMLVPRQILAGQIEEVIRKNGGKLLENCSLFDLYEGAQIAAGFKSYAYSLVFRAKDHTLEDAEIGAVMEKIYKGLDGLGIELRK